VAIDLIVIGASLGGLQALETLIAGLPRAFRVPIVVVQHRSVQSQSGLTAVVQRHTTLRVREPYDKEAVEPGRLYLAPADYHLMLEPDGFSLSTEAPVSYARPSIDVLFESAAETYGPRLCGVVLTGANQDGAMGARAIKEAGGCLIVQDPDSAECPVMPRAALQAAPPDYVAKLTEIAPLLVRVTSDPGGSP
jgi:two-component system chemotaxis response regulator CheB